MTEAFDPYPKIYRLGSPETEGILDGPVYIEEKIDGANLSVWLNAEGGLVIASRKRIVANGDETFDGFNGAVEYVRGHEGIRTYLSNPSLPYGWCLRGEWLVKHTISYPAEFMRQFYLFDVGTLGVRADPLQVDEAARACEIKRAPLICYPCMAKVEDLERLCDVPSWLGGGDREGVVIKRPDFRNRYGNPSHAKLVRADFKARNRAAGFQGSRHDDPALVVAALATEDRIKQVVAKIVNNKGSFTCKDLPRAMGTLWHDLFTEELWGLVTKKKIKELDFNAAQKAVNDAARPVLLNLATSEGA